MIWSVFIYLFIYLFIFILNIFELSEVMHCDRYLYRLFQTRDIALKYLVRNLALLHTHVEL
jgi:hypothetical protein